MESHDTAQNMLAQETRPGMSRRRFISCAGMGIAGSVLCGACSARGQQIENPSDPMPFPAEYWEKAEGKSVKCLLCPRQCVVPDGLKGHCGVRKNIDGEYFTLVYGYPCAKNNDPIEKKPFFHVYPGTKAFSIATVGCNIECRFCQNWDISQAAPSDFPVSRLMPEEIADMAKKHGSRTIAYTYSEPTIFYEYMADCAKAGKDLGIDSVVVSNGYISVAPQEKLFSLVKAIKIDLKAFTESFYRNVCSGELEPVKESLKRLSGSGVWCEIVVLVIPTLNDGKDELKRMSAWIAGELGENIPVHFTRFHPMYKLRNIPVTPPETLLSAHEIARGEGCRFVYTGNIPGGKYESTYCPSCDTMLIRRYGFRILENKLQDGKCYKCGTVIPGVWS